MLRPLASLLVACLAGQSALSADNKPDPCTTTAFARDVSHELAVAKQTPAPMTAAANADQHVPRLELAKLYQVKLSAQSGVTFALAPGRAKVSEGAQAGLVRFHTAAPGRYRVALSSGHWIDIVDGEQRSESSDFQRAHGCERPHKIVEFVLPGGKDLTLQLSGSPDATVMLSVTSVGG